MTTDDKYIWGPQKVGNLTAMASYEDGWFLVKVVNDESGRAAFHKFLANFEPRFGIDLLDSSKITAVAEALAQHVEKLDEIDEL